MQRIRFVLLSVNLHIRIIMAERRFNCISAVNHGSRPKVKRPMARMIG
jgi:hypothetical protein